MTNAGYWDYPTQSDSAPGNIVGGAANQANYRSNGVYALTQSSIGSSTQNYLTEAGLFSNSAGAYGTFDQGGNIYEWNDVTNSSLQRLRGGSWASAGSTLQSSSSLDINPTTVNIAVGFRVATVPEPSTYALLALAAAGFGAHFLRRVRK